MEKDKKFRNQNTFLIILGALLCIIYGGKDSHYWGLVESTSEEILTDVGMGKVDPYDIVLNNEQRKEIVNLIQLNPNNYNAAQKSLVFKKNILDKSGEEILFEVGSGLIKPNDIKLTPAQIQQINEIISNHPNDYNDAQKRLIPRETSINLLKDVGEGKLDPKNLKLNLKQLKEVRELIRKNPEKYNDKQKSILTYISGKEILNEVGLGYTEPTDIKLTEEQYNEIKNLIKAHPNDFNEIQKALLIIGR